MNEEDQKTEEQIILPEEGSFLLSSSPHIRSGENTGKIMCAVMICLLPAVAAAVWNYHWQAVRVIAWCMASCVFFEYAWNRLSGRTSTLKDCSAMLTGLLLALNVPPLLPGWLCVVGAFIAIIVAKQVFGGLGQNPFNPAAAARVALLIGAAKPMTTWMANPNAIFELDGVTGATPLAAAKAVSCVTNATPHAADAMTESGLSQMTISGFDSVEYLQEAFLGNIGGSLGETSTLAILLGGLILIFLKIVKPYIPAAVLLTVVIFIWIVNRVSPGLTPGPLFHLCSGGLMLGAFFMATDYVTSPVTNLGGIIFGMGIGVIVCVIRIWGSYPEGMSFAIIIMNALVPLIDKLCYKRPFGWSGNMFQPRRGEIK